MSIATGGGRPACGAMTDWPVVSAGAASTPGGVAATADSDADSVSGWASALDLATRRTVLAPTAGLDTALTLEGAASAEAGKAATGTAAALATTGNALSLR